MGIRMKWLAFLVCLGLCLVLVDSSAYSQAANVAGQVTLTMPRTPNADEAVRVELTVGVLPRDASIVVRTMDGEIAGAVSPFGVKPGEPAGVYTIPLSEAVLRDGEVSLMLELEQKNVEEVRAPSEDEFLGAELVYIPATPFE